MIRIKNAGMLSTVQDLGRVGVMTNGFTHGGVMDTYSTRIANLLCSNDVNAPVIEMTMLGITAEFCDDCVFALSGGDFQPRLNSQPIKNNKAYTAKAGDVLALSSAKSGMRCYLAVGGGFKVESIMGSASTDLKLGIGGFKGRRLKAGDELETGESKNEPKNIEIPCREYGNVVDVRFVYGPQDDMFTDTDKALFENQLYTVTPSLDRMGIRLCGIALRGVDGMDIISEGIAFGSVQIPPSGMPIILMADHQTTGGYAKIATVISVDLPLLAQVKPYDKIRFHAVSLKKAQTLAKKERRELEGLFK